MSSNPTAFPLPDRTIDYCDGPFTASVTQTDKFTTRWAAWFGQAGVKIAQLQTRLQIIPPWPPESYQTYQTKLFQTRSINPDGRVTESLGRSISLGFALNGTELVAVGYFNDTFMVGGYDNSLNIKYWGPFNGSYPLLFQDELPYVSPEFYENSGLWLEPVCFYIKPADNRKIFFRNYAESGPDGPNFGIEHSGSYELLNRGIMALKKIDRYNTYYYKIWAVDTDNSPVHLVSYPYPKELITVQDKGVMQSFGLLTGSLFATVIYAPSQSEEATLQNFGLVQGLYFPTVIYGPTQSEETTLQNFGLNQGLYFLAVVWAPGTQSEEVTLQTFGLGDSSYVKMVNSSSQSEYGFQSTTLFSGSYHT